MREARALLGNPIKAKPTKKPGFPAPPKQGTYVARPGAAGSSDGTTDNAAHAKRDTSMGFSEAQDYLASAYGISRAEARAALIAARWIPTGQRTTRRSKRPDDRGGRRGP